MQGFHPERTTCQRPNPCFLLQPEKIQVMLQMDSLRIFSVPASWLGHIHSFLLISFSFVWCVLGPTVGFRLKRSFSCSHSGYSLRERHIKITAKQEAEGRSRLYVWILLDTTTVISNLDCHDCPGEYTVRFFWCVVSPQTIGRPNLENDSWGLPSRSRLQPVLFDKDLR